MKIGTSTATEVLFVKYMIDNLELRGRCGVIVPEGVLFGSTGAHKELRRMLMENNRVEAVLSLPGGVFQPYSGVKTSVLVFAKGGRTERVMFLHASNDGFKLDANHDQPIEADDLPGLIAAFAARGEKWPRGEAAIRRKAVDGKLVVRRRRRRSSARISISPPHATGPKAAPRPSTATRANCWRNCGRRRRRFRGYRGAGGGTWGAGGVSSGRPYLARSATFRRRHASRDKPAFFGGDILGFPQRT